MSKRRRPLGRPPSERRRAGMPEIPPAADKLRDAHKVIDPNRTYAIEMPDGSVHESTGAELIATADDFTALVDAQRAGNERGMRKAVEKIRRSL
jgi:hypothetical protein